MTLSERVALTGVVLLAIMVCVSVGGHAVHALLTHAVAALDATVPR